MENNINNQTGYNKSLSYSDILTVHYIIVKVEFYCTIVIVTIGIIVNIISLLIFTRPNLNKKTNTGIFFTLLCIFNILIFIKETFLGDFSYQLFDYNIWFISTLVLLNIDLIIKALLTEILTWIQVLICFDRFILVIYPMKTHIMRKKV